eukprot:jgi/Botrbrau1/15379/Bobra.43_2s0010.1
MAEDPLRKISVYRTATRVYLFARTKDRDAWRVLKFSRDSEATELDVVADKTVYSEKECRALLKQINDGNLQHGGLKFVCVADAIIGCFRFLEGYFLLLVTKKRFQGTVCGSKIYGIGASALVSLCSSDKRESRDEQRYRKLLGGLELTKDFFFSYDYPLWQTVQGTLDKNSAAQGPWDPSNMFVWNEYLTRPLRDAVGSLWVKPLIHGFWQQRSFNVDGHALTVTLVARRSKFFAGTRYRKRGVNDDGQVANHVEVEQIVSAGFDMHTRFPVVASMVQVRGSIPLYWEHELGTRKVKPAIHLQRYDPLYTSTCLHFQDLASRYGSPLLILNLVKSTEKVARESILRRELDLAIEYYNRKFSGSPKVQHIPWDFKSHAKQPGGDILQDIAPVLNGALGRTGIFVCPPAPPSVVASRTDFSKDWEPSLVLQRGVLRTNCIDCLDRTNAAQFAYGLAALGHELRALEISDSDTISPRSSLAAQLMDMYEQMGNVISRQYGGSDAHSTLFQRERGNWEAATTMRDKLTSLHRFYSNHFSDSERQDAINLFLGHFRPKTGSPPIWELEHDLYLHSAPRRSLLPSIPELPLRLAPGPSAPSVQDAPCPYEGVKTWVSGGQSPQDLPSADSGTAMESTSVGPDGIDFALSPECSNRHGGTAGDLLAPAGAVGVDMGPCPPGTCGLATEKELQTAERACGATESQLSMSRVPTAVLNGFTRRHGVASFRTSANQAKRAKLESFDRKIGKQPNFMQDVRTRADPQKSYLPLWLASPLGRSSSAKPPVHRQFSLHAVHSSVSLASSSESESSSPLQATPKAQNLWSMPSSPSGVPRAMGRTPGGLSQAASPSGVAVLSGPGVLCISNDPISPLQKSSGRRSQDSSLSHALALTPNGSLKADGSLLQFRHMEHVPPYPTFAFEEEADSPISVESSGVIPRRGHSLGAVGSTYDTGGAPRERGSARRAPFRGVREFWKPAPQAASVTKVPLERRSTSADLGAGARNICRATPTADRSMRALDLAGSEVRQGSVSSSRRTSISVVGHQGNVDLGLTPLQTALWKSSSSTDRVWYTQNEQTHKAYDRFMSAVAAQLHEAQTQALVQQYSAFCNPVVPISLDVTGFESGAGAAWRQQAGLLGARTFGELSLRSLVSAL